MPVAMPEQQMPSTSASVRPASSSASRIIAASSTRPRVSSSPVGDAASATPTIAASPRSDRPIGLARLLCKNGVLTERRSQLRGVYRPLRHDGSGRSHLRLGPMDDQRLPVDATTPVDRCVTLTEDWVEEHVPVAWREAAARGGNAAIREVRGRAEYEAWYPVFGASGLVMPTWAPEYGGLGVTPETASAMRAVLAPVQPARAQPARAQQHRGGAVRTTAPRSRSGASSGRSCATRRSGASSSASPAPAPTSRRWRPARCSTVTSGSSTGRRCGPRGGPTPTSRSCSRAPIRAWPKNKGITYFLIDMHQPGVDVRPLRHISGEVEFNEVFLDQARVPEFQRLGDVNDGWRVANATLSSERQMVAGAGSGGSGRVGGSGVDPPVEARSRSRHRRRPARAPAPRRALERGAHPRVDQPAGGVEPRRRSDARARRRRSARCTRPG